MAAVHLAGIVPIITKPMDFGFDWHDCLMPVAPNFYAVENAVLECARAGCDTIWLVANDDTTPLVRHRLGDYVQDPVWVNRNVRFKDLYHRPIPIFYVPMDLIHDNKRNCISWTILYGAKTALDVGSLVSKWVAPSKFYVSFPYSVYPTDFMSPHRPAIKRSKNYALTFRDKSFTTNDMLAFTFNRENLKQLLDKFQETENSFLLGEELENEEEFFEQNFTLDKTFGCVTLDIDKELEVPWYYPIDSWENYGTYLSSPDKSEISHPGELIMSYQEANPIGRQRDNSKRKGKND